MSRINEQIDQIQSQLRDAQSRQQEAERQKREIEQRTRELTSEAALRKQSLEQRNAQTEQLRKAQQDIAQIEEYQKSLGTAETQLSAQLKQAKILKSRQTSGYRKTVYKESAARFNPVYVNGKLTGYYDVLKERSIPIQNVPIIERAEGIKIKPVAYAIVKAREDISSNAPSVIKRSEPVYRREFTETEKRGMKDTKEYSTIKGSPTFIVSSETPIQQPETKKADYIGLLKNLAGYGVVKEIIKGTERAGEINPFRIFGAKEEKFQEEEKYKNVGFDTGLGTWRPFGIGLSFERVGVDVPVSLSSIKKTAGTIPFIPLTFAAQGTSLGFKLLTSEPYSAASYGQYWTESLVMAGQIAGGFIGTKITSSILDLKYTRGMKELKLENYKKQVKPFLRREAGMNRVIYMERVKPFSVTKPSTWITKIKGYKAGQFLTRRYRLIAPEVQAGVSGAKEVTYYDIIKGKPTLITRKTTPFPYDAKSTFLNWFKRKQLQKYYLPSGKKGYVLGYSATSSKWATNEISIQLPEYVSGKGISTRFFRIGNRYQILGTNLDALVSPYGYKPYLYAEYVKKAIINPAKYEASIKNPFNPKAVKLVKKYIYSTQEPEAVFNIPLYKPEVEATVYGMRNPLQTDYYIKLQGRRIPIQQSEIIPMAQASEFTQAGLKITGLSSSIPPSPSQVPILSYVFPSSVPTSSISPRSSYISKISSTSFYGYSSSPSAISKPSSVSILRISKISNISKMSKPSLAKYSKILPKSAVSGYSKPHKILEITKPLNRISYGRADKEIYQKIEEKKIKREKAYQTLVKRFGKWKYLKGYSTRAKAIKKGEQSVLKNLGASFKVIPTKMIVYDTDINYIPSKYLFRGYRVSKGKRIPLRDEWIQLSRKRLGSIGERMEIKRARRRKLNKFRRLRL